MPRAPSPLTRVDPDLAPLWRDGETLQFGLHGAVRLRVTEPWMEMLVSRLCHGIPLATFDVIAHSLGAPRAAAREVLRVLRPVLRTDPIPSPAVWVESVNLADSRTLGWMREALTDLELPNGARADPKAVGVILVHGAAAAVQLHPYLREDIPHLPVSFESGGVTAGPLVIPGETPCLSCRDGHERERDAAWPLLHSQLVGRVDSAIPRPMVSQAAGLVHRLLRLPQDAAANGRGGRFVRLSADGRRVWHSVRFHAECRCRATSFRSQRGNGMANALRAPLPETRTA